MGSYSRNVDFRNVPIEQQRRGRFVLDGTTDIAMGAPFVAGPPPNEGFTDALPATLATGAQSPKRGLCGIGIYEWIDYHGLDPELATPGERDKIPYGRLFQVISGTGVKVVFKNTANRLFLNTRQYPGRMMVAGMGATPTVLVGDWLTPGTGNDTAGYWARTTTEAQGWLRVTSVDTGRQEVEAEFVF